MNASPSNLPAQRIDARGRLRVDWRAVALLALPLIANSGAQLMLNLTDVWFVGRISTNALAAIAAVHWLVIVVLIILSGVGLAVQTIVAQAYGGRRQCRASQAVWLALWGILLVVPLFLAAGFGGRQMLAHLGLQPAIGQLAADFWLPRVAGSPFGAAAFAVLGFFNGIGRTRVTLMVTAVMAVSNAILNQLFIFGLGLGIAGSGFATTGAQAIGVFTAMAVFLSPEYRARYRSHLTWKPKWAGLLKQMQLGFPMGLLWAADLFGFSVFQLMQVRLGAAAGAATQVVMMLTACSYLPGVGIAMAGTTLVGQSIGAGSRDWAFTLGNRIIALVALYMGATGLVLALCGPWLLPPFLGAADAQTASVLALGAKLLWLAAIYQFFDGLNLGSGLCLRGAGDAVVPALLVIALSWLVFIPLAHALTFAPGQGWYEMLPLAGRGAIGGWQAVVIYIALLGVALLWRWRSRAWMRLKI
jgi:MATE family multidrug resistance protein